MPIRNFFNEGNLLKLRLVIYSLLIILSFLIFVGVAVMKGKAGDYCPLYLRRHGALIVYSNNQSVCDYSIAVAVIFQLVYLLFRMVTLILKLLGNLSHDFFLFSNFFEFLFVIIDGVAGFLTFVSACILTAGTNWRFGDHWFKWSSASEVAQAGAWISVFHWAFIAAIGFLVLFIVGKVPFIGSRKVETPANNQEEMVDPAAQKFGV